MVFFMPLALFGAVFVADLVLIGVIIFRIMRIYHKDQIGPRRKISLSISLIAIASVLTLVWKPTNEYMYHHWGMSLGNVAALTAILGTPFIVLGSITWLLYRRPRKKHVH
jgi:hypothetical protein